ncbi:MAG: tRNA (guanosine(37)-N1)-methyltransferase TrmD [Clostridia bacterium]|nr:tRNA (guanosine(37)-N1)-methyltransferase TrmD [Clostridia bacterium]
MSEKLRIDIMTLFPEFVDFILSESIIGRARRAGTLDIRAHNIRDYSEDKHRRVDDTPYGGGRGMLMAAPPIYRCYKAIEENIRSSSENAEENKPYVIYMSPRGRVFTNEYAKELSEKGNLVILCGHYEGVDERLIEEIVDEEVSIGDYVLTGGEVPACIVADAVGRLVDGVLTLPECHENESFEGGLLEYPQYTRPAVWMGREVPDVLLSGHHANIDKWRHEKSVEITKERRPDLLEKK